MVGIYFIINKQTGKRYIGQAKDTQRRVNEHFSTLARGKHINLPLQNSYNKHGREGFDIQMFPVAIECLDLVEGGLIQQEGLYNICKRPAVPPGMSGKKFTKEHKAKISAAQKGNTNGSGNRGIVRTEENKAKIRVARIGTKHRPESIERMKKVHRHSAWQYRDDIIAMRDAGINWSVIARKYNVSGIGVIKRIYYTND